MFLYPLLTQIVYHKLSVCSHQTLVSLSISEIHFVSFLGRFCTSCQTQWVNRLFQLLLGLSFCSLCRRRQDLWRPAVQLLWLSWSSLFLNDFVLAASLSVCPAVWGCSSMLHRVQLFLIVFWISSFILSFLFTNLSLGLQCYEAHVVCLHFSANVWIRFC